jgi:Putative Tad-like Flp pilus-assembly
MKRLKIPFLQRFHKDERGQTGPVIVVTLFSIMALAASGVETGHVYYAYRILQASTNSAALAGAEQMPDVLAATTDVTSYSSQTGDKNATSLLQNVSITPTFYCSTKVASTMNVGCQTPPTGEGSCTSGSSCNALKVVQTASVNLWFGGLVGIRTFNLKAMATASMRGGSDIPYNIAVIIDTTESMTSAAASGDGCGTGATQIDCAVSGLADMLEKMDPCPLNVTCSSSGAYVDDVSLFVFPAIKAGDTSDDTTCPTTNPPIVPYSFPVVTTGSTQNLILPTSLTTYPNNAGTYQVVTFNDTYKSNDETTTLQSGDGLASAVGVGSGCTHGLQAPGGEGTYYAQVIYAAQAALATQQADHAGSQNVLIILSDGDAYACNLQAYTAGGGNATCNGGYSQIVALNCPTIGSTPCTGSPLNGTGTSSTNASGYKSPTYPSEIGQCGQAVQAAQAATQAGTTVYTVAMGSETSGGCTTDADYTTASGSTYGAEAWPSGTYSGQPCNAIAAMATDANTFYSDNTSGCAATNNSAFTTMSAIFQAIGNGLTSSRLIPNGTT